MKRMELIAVRVAVLRWLQTGRVYLDASSFLKCRFVLLAHNVKGKESRAWLESCQDISFV